MEHPEFKKYLIQAIGPDFAEKALDALSEEASVSIRLNPSKLEEGRLETASALLSERVPWSPYGFFLPVRPQFTLDPAFHAGQYYVQDSSAMFVGAVFRRALSATGHPGRPVRVLDLCAAPGGKTTDLAASLRKEYGDRFLLVANEVMKQRAGVLAENVARWGDPNVCVTSSDPSAFASLGGFFDLIVADVPCSGEGMFRKDEEALKLWSAENVELCRTRQRRIVADVWPALAQGGIFIYSTCTFNRYENDGNVGWIVSRLGAEVLDMSDLTECGPDTLIHTELGISLVPGMVRGEGQFCSWMKKTAEADFPAGPVSGTESRRKPKAKGKESDRNLQEWVRKTLDGDFVISEKGELITALPQPAAADIQVLDRLHPLSRGVAVGTPKGKDFVPHADLALSIKLKKDAFPRWELDRDQALAFLHRDNLVLAEAPKGLLLLEYQGQPLGFVKNLGNRCNSLLPASRRIRMNLQ